MPVLSLPFFPRLPSDLVEYLPPIRVPFPFMRIASILPQAINEPFRASLLSLFKLAWSAKLQIPVLITVVFMACDIRLQLEINIIWEANGRQQANHLYGQGNRTAQRLAIREDMRRAALVGAALYQQQRRRLIQEMRLQQTRQREAARRSSNRPANEIPIVAPLAVEEDSDLDLRDPRHDHDDDSDGLLESDSDTITCSRRSTTSEAGVFGSDEIDSDTDTEEGAAAANHQDKNKQGKSKKKKKLKRSRPSSKEPDDDDDDEDTTSDDDDEDDDDDYHGGGGMNGGGGSSHYGGGGGGSDRYRDDHYDHDSDGDDNSNDESGSYGSPLVVEVEIRHRSQFPPSSEESYSNFSVCRSTTRIPFVNYKININKPNYFKKFFKCDSLSTTTPFPSQTKLGSYYENAFGLLSQLHLL